MSKDVDDLLARLADEADPHGPRFSDTLLCFEMCRRNRDAARRTDQPREIGTLIAALPRERKRELRFSWALLPVTKRSVTPHRYFNIREWSPVADKPGMFPTRKGVAIRPDELHDLAEALVEAIKLSQQEEPLGDIRRELDALELDMRGDSYDLDEPEPYVPDEDDFESDDWTDYDSQPPGLDGLMSQHEIHALAEVPLDEADDVGAEVFDHDG